MFATAACKASIKAGEKLSYEGMREVVEGLRNAKIPYTCPHGRPTMIRLSKKKIICMVLPRSILTFGHFFVSVWQKKRGSEKGSEKVKFVFKFVVKKKRFGSIEKMALSVSELFRLFIKKPIKLS